MIIFISYNDQASELTKTHRSTFNDLKISNFVDIDSLYDITRVDEIMVKFGKHIEHENLRECKLLLKKSNSIINSTRRKNKSFFLSMEPPSESEYYLLILGGKRISLVELERETCNPEDYLNIWLGIELSIHFFQKITFKKVCIILDHRIPTAQYYFIYRIAESFTGL